MVVEHRRFRRDTKAPSAFDRRRSAADGGRHLRRSSLEFKLITIPIENTLSIQTTTSMYPVTDKTAKMTRQRHFGAESVFVTTPTRRRKQIVLYSYASTKISIVEMQWTRVRPYRPTVWSKFEINICGSMTSIVRRICEKKFIVKPLELFFIEKP